MITYNIIEAGGTSTDVLLTTDGMDLILEMTYYKSGIHNLNRSGDMTKETITLTADHNVDTKVSIYLLDDDTTEGEFVVATCRAGLDTLYEIPSGKLIAFISEFNLPAGTTDLDTCDITAIKVVELNG